MKDKLTVFTKYFVDICLVAAVLTWLSLPFSIYYYGKYNTYFAKFYVPLLVLFLLTGALTVLILRELHRMMQTVLRDDCFVTENVSSLKKMGTYSFLIAAITTGRLVLYLTPAVLVIIGVFLTAGLFSKVLAQVFDRAVHYKQENDLTI